MKRGGSTEAKRRAGESAAAAVEDGMVVGLGTGSTTAYAIRALGERVADGLNITGIPTSVQSESLAREVGIPLTSLDITSPDIAIDGADQVAGSNLIKGGGGAHAREKIVDAAADRFLVVVDEGKMAETLDIPIPVSILPIARQPVSDVIRALGGEPTVREAEHKDGPVVTDNGAHILDCDFGTIDAPASLAEKLDGIPGVVAHGLFIGLADEIHVGTDSTVRIVDSC